MPGRAEKSVSGGADSARSNVRPTVQFDISELDDDDFMALVGEIKNRTTVARILFMYGLNNSKAAFGDYAAQHEERRKRRLRATIDPDDEPAGAA